MRHISDSFPCVFHAFSILPNEMQLNSFQGPFVVGVKSVRRCTRSSTDLSPRENCTSTRAAGQSVVASNARFMSEKRSDSEKALRQRSQRCVSFSQIAYRSHRTPCVHLVRGGNSTNLGQEDAMICCCSSGAFSIITAPSRDAFWECRKCCFQCKRAISLQQMDSRAAMRLAEQDMCVCVCLDRAVNA